MSKVDWEMTVCSSGTAADPDEIRRALQVLLSPGHAHELRSLPSGRSAFVSLVDIDAAVKIATEAAPDAGIGLYYTLNPIIATNRAARDKDVISRRWLLIDIDPVKADEHKDHSSSEAEKDAVRGIAATIAEDLWSREWPAPVLIDSGNGFHLLYAVDLPNDALSKQWISESLKALAKVHDSKKAKVDTSVHNASRIAKLPGTWARKGPDTPERPHRLCRILSAPPSIETVTTEQLAALAESGRAVAKPYALKDSWEMVVSSGSTDRLGAYVRSALNQELMRVALAAIGDRNNALNAAAFALGQFVGAGVLEANATANQLEQAAIDVGLSPSEIRQTIKSGLNAGIAKPRKLPQSLQSPTGKPRTTLRPDAQLVVQASTVRPKQVDWLMPNRIPYGFITLFAGRTGLGKSFVTCDITARLTSGEPWPATSGECPNPGNVLLISEDPFEYVLTPRLLEMGADLKRVFYLSWEAMAEYHLSDTDMLDRAFSQAGNPTLIVIDPPTNFLHGKDEHKNSEVRQTLMALVAWLNGRRTACILITHVSKSTGKGHEAINRVIGSVAWATTSRIAHAFNQDPEQPGRSLWLPMKSNLGPLPKGLAYRIVRTETLARVEWLGEVDTTADEASNHQPAPKAEKRAEKAADWLRKQFDARQSWSSDELVAAAALVGISRSAVWEAKRELGIKAQRIEGHWHWEMPAQAEGHVNGDGNRNGNGIPF